MRVTNIVSIQTIVIFMIQICPFPTFYYLDCHSNEKKKRLSLSPNITIKPNHSSSHTISTHVSLLLLFI